MQPFAQACGLPVGRHAAIPSPLQLDLLQRLPLGFGHDGMHRQHRAQADEREGHEDTGSACGVMDAGDSTQLPAPRVTGWEAWATHQTSCVRKGLGFNFTTKANHRGLVAFPAQPMGNRRRTQQGVHTGG